MTGGLLPGADRDLVNILAKRIEQICEAVWLNTKVTGMKDGQGRHRRDLRRRREVRATRRSIASSCRSAGGPNSKIPGLDKVAGRGRQARLHRHRQEPADRRADDLRDWRRRRRADARAQGVARGARRGRCHRRRPQRRVRAGGDSRRRLHRSRDRLGRTDRDRRREAGDQGRRSRSFPGAPRAARSRSAAPTASRSSIIHPETSACWASASAVPAPAS